MTAVHARSAPAARRRWRALLVPLLVVALAIAVALVLAQSAGAIHLGILGSNG